MDQNTPQQAEKLLEYSSKKILFMLFFFLLTCIFIFLLNFFVVHFTKQRDSQVQTKTLPPETKTTISPQISPSASWSTYAFVFTNLKFDYPSGWHFVGLWPNFYQKTYETPEDNDVKIIINNYPIDLVYGHIPQSAIVINDHCCYPGPDCNKLFQEHMDKFKKWLKDYKEEVLETEMGHIYHISQNPENPSIDIYYDQFKPIERYYFITPPNFEGPDCEHFFYTQTYSLEKSPILREITKSFRIEGE